MAKWQTSGFEILSVAQFGISVENRQTILISFDESSLFPIFLIPQILAYIKE